MTPGQVGIVVLVLMVLIGGPLYLVSQAIERHGQKKAAKWKASAEGIQYDAAVASMRMDSLGPLSPLEHEALLFNILWVTTSQGAISWEGIVAQAAAARQMARDHPEGLPLARPLSDDRGAGY